MQVQVNPSVAARNIAEFVKTHGGDVRHMEVLELMARVCGFTTYQALKAAEQSQAKVGAPVSAPTSAPAQHPLENPSQVVHRQSLVEWDENDRRVAGPEYDLVVERFPGCLRLMVKEKGVDSRNVEGTHLLDAMVEIQKGVPCVHLTNDPNALLMSAFACSSGMYFRPEDEDVIDAGDASGPLKALVKATSEAQAGFVVQHGKARSGKEVKRDAGPGCDACGGQVRGIAGHPEVETCTLCQTVQDKALDKTVAELGLPGAASVLQLARPRFSPTDNMLATGIHVELFTGQSTWKDFLYLQVSECAISGFGVERTIDLKQYVGDGHSCYTGIPTSVKLSDVRQVAQDVAHVAVYFMNGGRSPASIKEVLWLMVESEPLEMSRKVREMTERYSNHDVCYAALAAEYGIEKHLEPAAVPSTPKFEPWGGEEAHADLSKATDASLRNSVLHVQFDDSIGQARSWIDVSIVDPNFGSEPGDNVSGYTVFGRSAEDKPTRQAFVDALAPVAAYFLCQQDLKYMRELVQEIVIRPNALELVRKCQEIVKKAKSVHLACDAVEALLAVGPNGLVLAGDSEDGVRCRDCGGQFSTKDEGVALGGPCPSRECPSNHGKANAG